MKVGKNTFASNTRVWADMTGHKQVNTSKDARVSNISRAVETFVVDNSRIKSNTEQIAKTRNFQDLLKAVPRDTLIVKYPPNDPNDPEAPFLKEKRFNRFLDGGIHMLIDYDFRKIPKVEVRENILNMDIDKPYSLGEFGGKPTAMRVLSYGGLDSCVQMGGKSTPEELASNVVTPLDNAVSEFPKQYAPVDYKTIRIKSIVVHQLVNLARGKQDLSGMKNYIGLEKINLKKELEALGFDLSKEFTVNGKKFAFQNGGLVKLS